MYIDHIIEFGPPCSGKGAHAATIIQAAGTPLQKIEMGQICRDEVAANTAIGRQIFHTMWEGRLVDDKYIAQFITRFNLRKNTLLDGYPRNAAQAKDYVRDGMDVAFLQGYDVNPIVFYIETDDEVSEHRMNIRIAEDRAAGRVIRMDDEIDILRVRLKYTRENTPRALDVLDSAGANIKILDGNADVLVLDPQTGKREMCIERVTEISDFITASRARARDYRFR